MSLGKYAELMTESRVRLKMVFSPFTPSVLVRCRNLGEAEHWGQSILFVVFRCLLTLQQHPHVQLPGTGIFSFCGVNENNNNKIPEEQDEKQLSEIVSLFSGHNQN